MLKLVSEIHTRQGAVIFSHAFRAQLYLRPTRYRFPPRLHEHQRSSMMKNKLLVQFFEGPHWCATARGTGKKNAALPICQARKVNEFQK